MPGLDFNYSYFYPEEYTKTLPAKAKRFEFKSFDDVCMGEDEDGESFDDDDTFLAYCMGVDDSENPMSLEDSNEYAELAKKVAASAEEKMRKLAKA